MLRDRKRRCPTDNTGACGYRRDTWRYRRRQPPELMLAIFGAVELHITEPVTRSTMQFTATGTFNDGRTHKIRSGYWDSRPLSSVSLKNHLLTRLNVYVPTADNLVEVVDANNVQASAFRSAGRRITDQALHPENTIELLTGC